MQTLLITDAKEMIANTKELLIQILLVSVMLVPVLIGILVCIFFIMALQAGDFLSINYQSVMTAGDEAENTDSLLHK